MQRGSLADLTTFIAVADSLSFRVAASHLGVTASALSHSMRQLEERLGVRLLHRTTRSVSVTDATHHASGRWAHGTATAIEGGTARDST